MSSVGNLVILGQYFQAYIPAFLNSVAVADTVALRISFGYRFF